MTPSKIKYGIKIINVKFDSKHNFETVGELSKQSEGRKYGRVLTIQLKIHTAARKWISGVQYGENKLKSFPQT